MNKLPRRINEFTEPELDIFRRLCNFSDKERQYFELKAKDKSIIQISMEMNVSEATVSVYSKKVRQKILKVL